MCTRDTPPTRRYSPPPPSTDRFLFPSHPSLSHRTSTPTAERSQITQVSPVDATSITSCHARHSQVSSLSGPCRCRMCCLLYIGFFCLLSYVPLPSFRLRPPAPYACLFFLYLSPPPSRTPQILRLPSCFWTQFTKHRTPMYSSYVPARVCHWEDLHFLVFSLVPPLYSPLHIAYLSLLPRTRI